MMRAAILVGSAVAAIIAYVAGRDAEPVAADSGNVAGQRLRQLPTMTDPYRQAEGARTRLETLPAGLWADPPPADAVTDVLTPLSASPFDQPPTAAAPALVSPPSAPKVDDGPSADEIARNLSQEITAIVRSSGRPQLLLLDRTNMQRRALAVGETYRAGWKIARIESGRIMLSRGKAPQLSVPIAFAIRPSNGAIPVGPTLSTPLTSPTLQVAQLPAESRPRRRVTRPGNASR